MTKKSPIQTAIDFWTDRRKESPSLQLQITVDLFIDYLRELLPSEEKILSDTWDAAISHHEQEEKSPGVTGPRNPLPDKFKFLNQLYPEK